jgi:hypothetical protein
VAQVALALDSAEEVQALVCQRVPSATVA